MKQKALVQQNYLLKNLHYELDFQELIARYECQAQAQLLPQSDLFQSEDDCHQTESKMWGNPRYQLKDDDGLLQNTYLPQIHLQRQLEQSEHSLNQKQLLQKFFLRQIHLGEKL